MKPWGKEAQARARLPRTTALDIKHAIRDGLRQLLGHEYGWGPLHNGLPLRPDVFEYLHDYLCESDGPLNFDGCREPEILLDERGSVLLTFEGEGGELELTVPCGGVLIARQRLHDGVSKVEGRLPEDHDEFLDEIGRLRYWVRGVGP